jgi:signal transduction histidine kinase
LAEAADAARIVRLLDNAVAQTRTLARGLHPVQLEARGLMSSLEHLAAMVRDLFKIDCRFQCRQPVLTPDNVMATHLYRIAQEAINNAIKHGRSTQIRIKLADTSETTTLTVQNNGLAIPKRRSPKAEGLGLRIMQYRSEMIGGSLAITSHPQRGTTLVCMIPKG